MTDLLQILFRKALASLAGVMIAHNFLDAATADKLTGLLLPVIMLIVSVVWGKLHLGQVTNRIDSPKASGSGLPGIAFLAMAAGVLLFFSGCTTALNSNKIVSVKQRCFGVVLETTSTTANAPNVKLGFCSTVWQMLPTSTNSPIYAPNYMDTFELGQGLNPFATAITENTGSGAVMIGTNGEASAFPPK